MTSRRSSSGREPEQRSNDQSTATEQDSNDPRRRTLSARTLSAPYCSQDAGRGDRRKYLRCSSSAKKTRRCGGQELPASQQEQEEGSRARITRTKTLRRCYPAHAKRLAPQATDISMAMPSWRYRPRPSGRQFHTKKAHVAVAPALACMGAWTPRAHGAREGRVRGFLGGAYAAWPIV